MDDAPTFLSKHDDNDDDDDDNDDDEDEEDDEDDRSNLYSKAHFRDIQLSMYYLTTSGQTSAERWDKRLKQ